MSKYSVSFVLGSLNSKKAKEYRRNIREFSSIAARTVSVHDDSNIIVVNENGDVPTFGYSKNDVFKEFDEYLSDHVRWNAEWHNNAWPHVDAAIEAYHKGDVFKCMRELEEVAKCYDDRRKKFRDSSAFIYQLRMWVFCYCMKH